MRFRSLKAESIDVEVNVQGRDTPEPATSVVEDTAEVARKGKFEVIIGMGGGSILDVAKMASALVTNPGKTKDYFGPEKVPSGESRQSSFPRLRAPVRK